MLNQLNFKHKKRVVAIAYSLFILYIMIAATLLFFSPYRQAAYEMNSAGEHPYNLVPFKTIYDYIRASSHINTNIWVSNLFGNVLAFLPLGFFLPLFFKRMKSFLRSIVTVFLVTSAVEGIQFVTRVGSFDVDDIILNTAGGAIGYALFWIGFRLISKRNYQ